jgi:Arc/MetJ-type ribon-helix-helix transcriptional regulator
MDYSLNENNFFHFEEILSQEKIDDIERLAKEKQYLNECDVLKEKIRRIKDTLNYKFKESD